MNGEPQHLLIVDDDPLISESLSFAFAAEFDVVISHSRQHAQKLLLLWGLSLRSN